MISVFLLPLIPVAAQKEPYFNLAKRTNKHCIKHYDYDRKIRYKIGPWEAGTAGRNSCCFWHLLKVVFTSHQLYTKYYAYKMWRLITWSKTEPNFSKSPEKYSHWDFLPQFLSLHYYTTLEGVLGVQRRGQGQGTIICLFGPLFFSQNGMNFKKPTKLSKSSEKLLFLGYFQSLFNFGWKQRPKPIRWI